MSWDGHILTRAVAAGSGLALAAGLVACSVPQDAARSGGAPPPLVLSIGTNDPEGRPASDQVAEFARQVQSASQGAVRIEPRYRVGGEGTPGWDQIVARQVMEGELDLAMVPARAWDTEGVTSLRALQAPLLVTTDDHLDAVVRDDELSGELLGGLADVGVTGLALVPEGIRHLLSLDGTGSVVARLADGGEVRAPRSETTWAFFEELGAIPSDREPGAGIVAAESEIALAETVGTVHGVVGNLPLFPKANALVVNTDVLDGLSEQQQAWLREAAAATRDWAVDSRDHDASLATDYCEQGGTVVHDPRAASRQVTDAAAAVTAELARDPGTDRLLDRIDALRPAQEGTVLPECAPEPGTLTGAVTPDGGALPDGVYRVEFTEDYLADQGLSGDMIGHNLGVWTIRLRDGRFEVDQVSRDFTDRFGGDYQVVDDHLYWQPYPEEPPLHVTWRTTEDGDLVFPRILDGVPDAAFHWGLPWRRIGDVAGDRDPQPVEITASTIRPDGGDLPDGTYRFRLTDDYLEEHGLSPEEVAFNHGVWTTVLDDGRWVIDQVAPDVTDHFEGVYQVVGSEVWWRFHDVEEVIRLRWSVIGDGDLVFEEVPAPDVPDFQFDLVWERVD